MHIVNVRICKCVAACSGGIADGWLQRTGVGHTGFQGVKGLKEVIRDCKLAQDKGGPSKGGFLNNPLFSHTDLYLCNEINGMCIYTINYSRT